MTTTKATVNKATVNKATVNKATVNKATATKALWNQREADVDVAELAGALLGLGEREIQTVAAEDLLGWPETATLVEAAPVLLDRVSVIGADDDDSPEQQLMRWALTVVAEAGDNLNQFGADQFDDEALRERRAVADGARELLGHAALETVSRDIDVDRSERRVAVGSLRATQQPLLDFCQTHRRGIRPESVFALVDQRTAHLHRVLVATLEMMWNAGYQDRVTVRDGVVTIGIVAFRHPQSRGHDRRQGIMIGSTLVDVPDWPGQSSEVGWSRLRRRAGVMHPVLVDDHRELRRRGDEIIGRLRSIDDRLQPA